MPEVMQLISLALINFRNYKKQRFEFSGLTTVITGDNSAGKSNILEAIYLLATGKSFRAEKDEQMVLYGQEFGRVSGETDIGELTVFLSRTKRFLVNGVGKRRMDFVGKLTCVLFRPEDIDLVLGSPSLRREYLDQVLEQTDREYRRSNLAYQKGLRQRNKLLERIRDGEAERKQLLFWDQMLIKNGDIISNKRAEFLELVNQDLKGRGLNLSLQYDKSAISESRLKQYAVNEVAAAKTLVGPHRDEFLFIVQREGKAAKDLSIYGSRGEQRMAILGVKLAEFEFVKKATGEAPVLLLDDIFSELDADNRKEVLNLIDHQQTVITTADIKLLPKKWQKNNLIQLNYGKD
ncbi:MAG: DNA replication and repair protein RecF [Candidatus Beckwithbacteria bacterium]